MTCAVERSEGELGQGVRPCAIFTFAGVLLFWVITMVLGFIQPGYSHVERAVSELGMVGAPYSLIQRANFVVLGSAMIAFAIAAYRAYPSSGLRHWLAPGLLVLHGLGRMGEGFFAWNPTLPGSLVNSLHTVSGMLAVLTMILIVFALYWMMRGAEVSKKLQWYTLATGALFVFLFVVFGPVGLGPSIPLGLGQRVGFLIWYLWVVIVAGSLSTGAKRSS
jgi:hypothetical membrane protein